MMHSRFFGFRWRQWTLLSTKRVPIMGNGQRVGEINVSLLLFCCFRIVVS